MMDQQLGKHDRDTSSNLDLDHSKDSYTRRRLAADIHLSGASLEDIRKALEPKVFTDPATKVPLHYHRNLQVFDQSQADKLPPHRDWDHEIKLKPNTTPPHGPLYNMSEDELLVLRKFLQENLDKGFIRASTSQRLRQSCSHDSQEEDSVSV
jgi:hypothetical protein